MLDIVIGLVAVLAGGLVLELFAAARAPLGYQDEHGFHLGIPVGQAPDASLLSTPAPRPARRPQPAYVSGQLEPVSPL
jgi:hypothetical protein